MWKYNYTERNLNDYLVHYASPYYDPVKAHEYYEEHKKLKGRTSTAGLNEEGRKVAQYVKKQINEEKKSRLEAENADRKNKIDARTSEKDTELEGYKKEMSTKIGHIASQIKALSKNGKLTELKRLSLQKEINGLREENATKRAEVMEKYHLDKNTISETSNKNKETIREEADQKYEDELNKIKSESRYVKKKKDSW